MASPSPFCMIEHTKTSSIVNKIGTLTSYSCLHCHKILLLATRSLMLHNSRTHLIYGNRFVPPTCHAPPTHMSPPTSWSHPFMSMTSMTMYHIHVQVTSHIEYLHMTCQSSPHTVAIPLSIHHKVFVSHRYPPNWKLETTRSHTRC